MTLMNSVDSSLPVNPGHIQEAQCNYNSIDERLFTHVELKNLKEQSLPGCSHLMNFKIGKT